MALQYCKNNFFTEKNWYELAACKNLPIDIFFPIGRTGPALKEIQRAKSICQECPVVRECLDYAISTNQESGVWGCTSEDERKNMRRSPHLRYLKSSQAI
jgi:WhiB family redox-sensing transcriptional regulator